jgi:23S rRNA pseudouridine1911/1915/1917 synthase
MSNPQIIYEDIHVLVISKPAGLLSQGEHTGDPNVVDWCRKHFDRKYVGLIHRLDRNVSGIMVIAKRTKSAQRLTQALQNGELRRIYLAWVEGTVEKSDRWENYLVRDESENISRVVSASQTDSKKAVLNVKPVRTVFIQNRPISLFEFELETGRSHQIRAQAAFRKHFIVGDKKYGAKKFELIQRPALHSFRVIFPHPMSKEIQNFEAPLPPEMDFK